MEELIFDMDGTLWDSSENVAKAWSEITGREITAKDISSIMGLTMDVIAERFFPSMPEEKAMELMDRCAEHENEYLAGHGGRLYGGVTETLQKLSEGRRLFIVSNCQKGYIECFLGYYGLGKFFSDHSCWGDNTLSKAENIKLIIERNNIENPVYIGDTQGDCDSAYAAGAKFIHASYGFGTADRYDAKIDSFSELTKLFPA